MLAFVVAIFTGACGGAVISTLLRGQLAAAARFARRGFFLSCAVIILDVPDWFAVAEFSVVALGFLWVWLRNRPRRKRRLLRLLGNKARAVFAAMKSRMPKPNPRLAPVPT